VEEAEAGKDSEEKVKEEDKDTMSRVKDVLENIKLPKMHRPAFLKKQKTKEESEKVQEKNLN
jgi:hypothetical protein